MMRWMSFMAMLLMVSACAKTSEPIMLGTLERDRITIPAEASERIIRIDASEGDELKAGQSILTLDTQRIDASIEQARAEMRGSQAVLDELINGRRKEAIDVARAQATGATARAANARIERDRAAEIRKRGLNAQADLDRTETLLRSAEAERDAARANLAEFLNGSRIENIELAESTLAAKEAAVEQLELTRKRYSLVSAQDGRIDSIPFKLGSQPTAGAILASMLVGPVYARVYVPASQRNTVAIGSRCSIQVTGSERSYGGTVRSMRSDPAFTPYFALTGNDASRLAYRSEIVLEESAGKDLPVGQPVQVNCSATSIPSSS